MKLYYKIIALFIVIITLLLNSGCGKDSDSAIVYYGVNTQPVSVDPQTAQSVAELTIVKNIFEGLMREDENGNIVLGVAENYEKNGNTYTFKIKNNALWSNEQPVSAHDFVFAFKRALTPTTKSPDATSLFAIKNAKKIYEGLLPSENLGINALDNTTLEITLEYDDPDFLSTLTTAVAMPCNKEFFNNCKGKYGLEAECVLSNGSFKLTKWNTDAFAMRLYKNKLYSGNFKARVAAVFISKSFEKTNLELLNKSGLDIAEIPDNEIITAQNNKLNTAIKPNTVWVLSFGNGYNNELRESLIASLITHNPEFTDLPVGITPATNLFPEFFNINLTSDFYKIDFAKSKYKQAVSLMPDGKLPGNTLYYCGDGNIIDVIKKTAGHWQQNLGAYINIAPLKTTSEAKFKVSSDQNAITIYPKQINNKNTAKYAAFFNTTFNNNQDFKNGLLKGNSVPFAYSGSAFAYTDRLENVKFGKINSFIDFSFVSKKQ